MSIRATIILLTVPLFLALALVNGALLYFQEKAEMTEAMDEQALAAAVSSAEFISSMDHPLDELKEPLRAKALTAAARQINGLVGLYLAVPGQQPHALVPPSRPWSLAGLERPETARALPLSTDANGFSHVVAIAPTAGGAFVAARIDAESMFTRMATIREAVLLIVILAGLTATALAWFVARRIVSELEKNRQAIAAIHANAPHSGDDGLMIRESRDLADAVRLMEASRKAAAERTRRETARKDRERNLDTALSARRDELFAPLSQTLAGAEVAARITGAAPLGSFFALCTGEARAMLVLGRCSAESPQAALAQAAAARRFLEDNMFKMAPGECLAAARSAHDIAEIRSLEWAADEPAWPDIRLVALTGDDTAGRAAHYAERNRDAAPAALLDGIELLIEPDGVFAAVRRA